MKDAESGPRRRSLQAKRSLASDHPFHNICIYGSTTTCLDARVIKMAERAEPFCPPDRPAFSSSGCLRRARPESRRLRLGQPAVFEVRESPIVTTPRRISGYEDRRRKDPSERPTPLKFQCGPEGCSANRNVCVGVGGAPATSGAAALPWARDAARGVTLARNKIGREGSGGTGDPVTLGETLVAAVMQHLGMLASARSQIPILEHEEVPSFALAPRGRLGARLGESGRSPIPSPSERYRHGRPTLCLEGSFRGSSTNVRWRPWASTV